MKIAYDILENKKEGYIMQEERNCGCSCNNGPVGGLFNGGCGCGDSEILFFISIFLLLLKNCGCGCGRGCWN